MEEGSRATAEEERGQQTCKTTVSTPNWCSAAMILLHSHGFAPMAGLLKLPANQWICREDGSGGRGVLQQTEMRTKRLQFLGQ